MATHWNPNYKPEDGATVGVCGKRGSISMHLEMKMFGKVHQLVDCPKCLMKAVEMARESKGGAA